MPAKITINNNGSIRVEGEFEVFDAEGKQYDRMGRTSIGLCRCGLSQNKPFCDASHRTGGFQSTCPAREFPVPKPKPPQADPPPSA